MNTLPMLVCGVFFFIGLLALPPAGEGDQADRARWNKKFSGAEYKYGKQPAPFLKKNVALLKKGRALDIAAGEGRNAVFLAQNGFQVDALDISPAGLTKAHALAEEKGVAEELRTIEADLDRYRFPKEAYDTIIMLNFTKRDMTACVADALKEGGTFLYVARTLDYVRKQGKKFNPEYLWDTNEVLDHFGRFFTVVKYVEDPNDPTSQVFFVGIKKSVTSDK